MTVAGRMTSRLPTYLRTALFRGLRLIFRMTPMREDTRDRLRQHFLDRFQGVVPTGPRGQGAISASTRRAHVHSGRAAVGFVARRKEELPSPLPATLVAF